MGASVLIATQEPTSAVEMSFPLEMPTYPSLQRRPAIARPRRTNEVRRPRRRARAMHGDHSAPAHHKIGEHDGARFQPDALEAAGLPHLVRTTDPADVCGDHYRCFWHGHDDPACRDGRSPHSNESYWLPKLTRNKERDAASVEALD
jgi:G:T-mismatch repair DNA endonuclease (very short patch repair protein)